jgi:hypothetical protein
VGKKSSINTLPPTILDAVNKALSAGVKIDDIVALIADQGQVRSRSAVGRYAKKYSALAEEQREINSVAKAFASDFGDVENDQGRLMIQLITSLITKQILPHLSGEASTANSMDLRLLAAAVKDAGSAAKTEDDRKRLIRKEAFLEAAKAAETEARSVGASDAQVAKIKARLLGMAG